MSYKIVFAPTARSMLAAIKDRRVRDKIRAKVEGLAEEPDKQGQPLIGPLAGLRSVRAAGRYRILYRVDEKEVVVLVVAVGQRKEKDKADVYALARKLFGLRLLEPPGK